MMKTGLIFLPILQGNSLFKGLPKEFELKASQICVCFYAVCRECTHYKVTRIIGRKLQRCSENLLLSLKETSAQVAIVKRICRLKWGDRIELSVLRKFRST